jgi:hypothetical protein
VLTQHAASTAPAAAPQAAQDTSLAARVTKEYKGLFRLGSVNDIPTGGIEPAQLVKQWGADWRNRKTLVWNADVDADGKQDRVVLLAETPAGKAKREKAEAELDDQAEVEIPMDKVVVYFANGKKEEIGQEYGEGSALGGGVRVGQPGTKITAGEETITTKGSPIYKGWRVYLWEDGTFGYREAPPEGA